MNCRVCNTRVGAGASNCPNCGNPVGPNVSKPGETQPPQPKTLPAPGTSTAKLEAEESEEPAVDLATPVTPVKPLRSGAAKRRESEDRGARRAEPTPRGAHGAEVTRMDTPIPRAAPAQGPVGKPDRDALLELLASRPDQLDSGLLVYKDGKRDGVRYDTAVGEIDLLASDGRGALVVVMIAEHHRAEELVSEILQRMGWVRKHLGEGSSAVRGIVLVEEAPASLSYAAAAVADTVAFMTWRLALSFEPIEL